MQVEIKSSVIICTRNRLHDLLLCLESLALQAQQMYELIIVDSSDRPLSHDVEFTQRFNSSVFKNVRLDYVHTFPGLTYQRNVGIERATGDIVYFFDDDVILEPTYLYEMNLFFKQNPAYGGGMGSITNIPKKQTGWQRVVRALFLLQRDYSNGKFTWSGMPTHAYGMDIMQDVEVLGGCCMAFKKELIVHCKFDEKLTRYAYMEDCDASCRVSRLAPLIYNPRARLRHNNSPLARDKVIDNRAMFIKNYSYLFFKNFYSRSKIRIFGYAWSVTGLFIEALLIRNSGYIQGYIKGLKDFYYSRD